MNESIALLLKNIKTKVTDLRRSQQVLVQKNETLQKKITALETQNQQLTTALADAQTKLSALKTLQSNLSEAERKVLVKNIEQYIKQLDQTINILSE
jgi:predicted nuclease with TOPRIM domain